jgi:hypothetical protein
LLLLYKHIKTMSKTLATSYFMQTHDNLDTARKELYSSGIKSSYNEHVMIFSTLHNARNTMLNRYTQECNGLILERKSWKPLVVPPRSLRYNINTELSNKFLHQGLYHIYEVQDGTCFNMYHYNGCWVISTTRGHTMNDVKWNGDKSYQSIVTECLEKLGLTWETFTQQLDTTRCYSFGFRHPVMQKFREGSSDDIYRIWFIQSVCTAVDNSQYLWSSDACPIAIIPNQEVYNTSVGNFRELYKRAAGSLQDFVDKKEVCYGFILRSVNVEQTEAHSDLYIESSLMRTIRKTWYENNLIDMCHSNKWDKETAIVLHAYLDSKNYEIFQLLFPQYQDRLNEFHSMLDEIATFMASKTLDVAHVCDEKYQTIVDIMLASFADNIKLDRRGQSLESLKSMYFQYVCDLESFEDIMTHVVYRVAPTVVSPTVVAQSSTTQSSTTQSSTV